MNLAKKKNNKNPKATPERVLKEVLQFFTASRDFNGIPYYNLITKVDSGPTLLDTLSELINEQKIVAVFGDRHPNAHILALEPEAMDKQREKLTTILSDHTCFYPTSSVLNLSIDRTSLAHSPFTLELALGKPHLTPYFFDLSVLERYRNDPRYAYWASDTNGYISVHGSLDEPSTLRNSDQSMLQSFGFGHNKEVTHRVVVVYLRYLHTLTPEHQRIWQTYLLEGEHYVHPAYRAATMGEWRDEVGAFEAIKLEMQAINELCEKIGKQPLFRNDFKEIDLPRNFAFLIRPTVKEYHDWILTMEKVLVENLSKNFFRGDISLEKETTRADGKVQVRSKGTIELLEEWLSRSYRTKDPTVINQLMKIPRKIREIRQEPAHKLNDDQFDYSLFECQRSLVSEAYSFVQGIRIILHKHPKAKSYVLEEALAEGKIWNF